MKNNKRKKTKITKTNDNVYIIDFFKKNKGFTIALILSIIITIFFLFSLTLQTTSSEDIAYAKAINEELNSYLDFMISEVENDLLTNVEEPLDKYYFESIKNDFEWLKEKNNELFSSKENILMKMAGFGTFFDRILYLNEEFSFEITEPDYETTNLLIVYCSSRSAVVNRVNKDSVNVSFYYAKLPKDVNKVARGRRYAQCRRPK